MEVELAEKPQIWQICLIEPISFVDYHAILFSHEPERSNRLMCSCARIAEDQKRGRNGMEAWVRATFLEETSGYYMPVKDLVSSKLSEEAALRLVTVLRHFPPIWVWLDVVRCKLFKKREDQLIQSEVSPGSLIFRKDNKPRTVILIYQGLRTPLYPEKSH